MTQLALVTMWWFLAASYANSDNAPMALGPYPTAAMCLAAEHQVDQYNRAYWTKAELELWKPYDVAKAKQDDFWRRLAKANPKPGYYELYDGTQFCVRTNDDLDGLGPPEATPKHGCEDCDSISAPAINLSQPLHPWGPCGEPDPPLGPSVPKIPREPEFLIQVISHNIIQTCQPVRGWYKRVN